MAAALLRLAQGQLKKLCLNEEESDAFFVDWLEERLPVGPDCLILGGRASYRHLSGNQAAYLYR
jgi:hypothetical protein